MKPNPAQKPAGLGSGPRRAAKISTNLKYPRKSDYFRLKRGKIAPKLGNLAPKLPVLAGCISPRVSGLGSVAEPAQTAGLRVVQMRSPTRPKTRPDPETRRVALAHLEA